jgi:hypothetical protein
MTENNRDEYLKQYAQDHKEEIRATKRKSYHKLKNQPEKIEYRKEYYKKNKKPIQKRTKIWKEENKEEKKKKDKEYREKNKASIKIKRKEYKEKNKEVIKAKNAEYRNANRDEINEKNRAYLDGKRIKFLDGKYTKKSKIPKEDVINLLGGKCARCNITNLDMLTIDHINNEGHADRKEMKLNGALRQVKRLIKQGWSLEQLKEKFQVLCYNHNCAKSYRNYWDLSDKELSYKQRWRVKIWKEAYSFFGSCKTCGDPDIKFLTLSHVNDDGSERRKNGERMGTDLLIEFRGKNWPESIKKDFCLECWNCNCSRQVKKQRTEKKFYGNQNKSI